MTIREAEPADQTALMRLAEKLHPEQRRRRLKPVRLESKTFIATDDGATVGFALITLTDYGLESCGYIEELIVEEAHRRQGIGSELLDACLAWLRDNDIAVLFLSALDDAADAFYLARSFARCKRPWLVRLIAPKEQ